MKSKLLCHADNEREDERTDKREGQCSVVDLAFAFDRADIVRDVR